MDIFNAMSDDIHTREEIVKSPLNYMGNKSTSLEWILDLLPYEDTWVDVFGGSGTVTLARRPSKLDVFNDKHGGIAAFFIAAKENPDLLIEHIKTLPHSREIFAWCRDNVEKTQYDIFIRGTMFYYLVQCSFAGRAKYFGRVTKPISPIHNKLYNNLDLFYPVSNRFQKVQVENLCWRTIFKDFDTVNTVFFCDPPYYNSNVYQYSMSREEHMELCNKIFQLKGFVALSGFDNPVYDQFDWSSKREFTISNNCSSAATSSGSAMEGKVIDRGEKRIECLWIKEAG